MSLGRIPPEGEGRAKAEENRKVDNLLRKNKNTAGLLAWTITSPAPWSPSLAREGAMGKSGDENLCRENPV